MLTPPAGHTFTGQDGVMWTMDSSRASSSSERTRGAGGAFSMWSRDPKGRRDPKGNGADPCPWFEKVVVRGSWKVLLNVVGLNVF